jgi:hypothetical protein
VNDLSVKLTRQGTGNRAQGPGRRGKKAGGEGEAEIEIALKNIEKAQLVPEI